MSADVNAQAAVKSMLSGRSGTAALVLPGLFLAGVIFLCTRTLGQPVTCGGQRMQGDRCVNLENGSSSTLASMSDAPAQQGWFWALLIAIIWIWLIVRRFRAGASQTKQTQAHCTHCAGHRPGHPERRAA